MGGEINIGGRKIPVWVIAAGVLGALGLFILTRITGGGKSESDSVEGNLDAANLATQFQEALNDSNSALQKQIDSLTAANASTNSTLSSAINKAVTDLTTLINSKLTGGTPGGSNGGGGNGGGTTTGTITKYAQADMLAYFTEAQKANYGGLFYKTGSNQIGVIAPRTEDWALVGKFTDVGNMNASTFLSALKVPKSALTYNAQGVATIPSDLLAQL